MKVYLTLDSITRKTEMVPFLRLLVLAACLLDGITQVHPLSQEVVDYIGDFLDVKVDPISNLDKDPDTYLINVSLKLTNTGNKDIDSSGWVLYFTIMYGVKEEVLNCGLEIIHDNGLVYILKPRDGVLLKPHSPLGCTFRMKYHASARTDFMPNWYVTGEGGSPRLLKSTTGEAMTYVGPFDTPEKWKRDIKDRLNPFTPEERYQMNALEEDVYAGIQVFPTPLSMTHNYGEEFIFDQDWVIVEANDFQNEIRFLKKEINLGTVKSRPVTKYIAFAKIPKSDNDQETNNEEEYAIYMNITDLSITITSRETSGAFYGIKTLLDLLRKDTREINKIPVVQIRDKPRFQHRGLMIDVARNFHPKDDIIKVLEIMGMYKMNRLHLHLTDDEGWRIQIPNVIALTKIGSIRCHAEGKASPCLLPSLGSGPFRNSSSGSGHYSVEEFREILKFAKERHIKVIPEIDVPGHSRAAIKSMIHQTAVNDSGSMEGSFMLGDTCPTILNKECDREKFPYHWMGNTINPCMNSSYQFMEMVINGIRNIYEGVHDLDVIHIGGDEVVFADWDQSTICKQKYPNVPKSELHKRFMKKISNMVTRKGIAPALWEEGVYSSNSPEPVGDFNANSVFVYPWNNVWENGRSGRAIQFANSGFKVILSPATHLYFDHAQEPDPEERGLYWATRYTNTRKVFAFNAKNFYKNAKIGRYGQPIDREMLCGSSRCPVLTNEENIIGMQAHVWSETIRTSEQLQFMLFPRLLAVAERSWHQAAWETIENVTKADADMEKEWERFAAHIGSIELPRLEQKGIHYRVPPPGAEINNRILKCNTVYPNHGVQMSLDGNKWKNIPVHDCETGVHIETRINTVYLRSVSPVLSRPSRAIRVDIPTLDTSEAFCLRPSLRTVFSVACLVFVIS